MELGLPYYMSKRFIKFALLLTMLAAGVFLAEQESTGVPTVPPPLQGAPAFPNRSGALRDTSPELATLLRVVDGDTITIRFRGSTETVRFIGIDTPEKRENDKAHRDAARTGQDIKTIIAAGKAAGDYLRSLIQPGVEVSLEFDVRRRDKYGRLLAYVYRKDGVMLNEALVLGGFASAYTLPPDVRYASRFRQAEAQARREKRGLWR